MLTLIIRAIITEYRQYYSAFGHSSTNIHTVANFQLTHVKNLHVVTLAICGTNSYMKQILVSKPEMNPIQITVPTKLSYLLRSHKKCKFYAYALASITTK